ncbi:MAG TPA: hypothetical protein VMB50_05500 [Myxococcales bacterium]|nr:hypothetical protein [Myxococcales bacterium]
MAVESYERPIRHISWSAIFAGTLVALALEGVLTFLGNAIGLQLVNPLNLVAARTPDTGAVLWTLGIPLGCFFVGGLVAGVVWAHHSAVESFVTGLIVWALIGLFEIGLVSLMSFGTGSNLIHGTAALAPYNGALWLMFFSACLSLLGAVAGSMVAVRPSLRVPFYREERRPLTQ